MMKKMFSIKKFTLIEMVMVFVILIVLIMILLPNLLEAKRKAKFTRWFAYNRTCSNDADCVINYNFQEGEGLQLNNGCRAADVELYNSKYYNAYMQDITEWNNKTIDAELVTNPALVQANPDNNFEWIPGGRWGRYKKALQFDGSTTALVVPTSKGSNFSPYHNFTIMCWIKFDACENGDTPFSKSLWGTSWDAAAQYDMYINGYEATTGTGAFDVDCFRICGTWNSTDVDFKKGEWTHIALTYRYVPEEDTTAGPNGDYVGDEVPACEIMAYINGKALGAYIETYGENPGTCAATDWGDCYNSNVPLVIGCAGGKRRWWGPNYEEDDSSLLNTMTLIESFVFDGRMDEFLLYQKALTATEVFGHWEMGHE